MCWQVTVLVSQSDATHQSGAPLIVEGHNVVVQVIRHTVKVSDSQRFGSQLNDAAVWFHDDHVEMEVLHVRVGVSEPGQQYRSGSICTFEKAYQSKLV